MMKSVELRFQFNVRRYIKDLSPEEWRAFERAAAAGDLSHMVEPWCAWWTLPEARDIALGRDGTRVVAEMGAVSSSSGGGGGGYAFSGNALALGTETPGNRDTGRDFSVFSATSSNSL